MKFCAVPKSAQLTVEVSQAFDIFIIFNLGRSDEAG
jgi:hypothetical protein